VGHFLLVTGVLGSLAPAGRVVMLSSFGHTLTYGEGIRLDDLDAAGGYDRTRAYGQAKLANLLFANHLATRLPPGQTANSLHPGVINTNLTRHIPGWLNAAYAPVADLVGNKTIPQGAATQCYVATHPTLAQTTGRYFADCNETATSAHGADADLAARLWERTEELVQTL
jgi:WW domain-containing oxidoreductase